MQRLSRGATLRLYKVSFGLSSISDSGKSCPFSRTFPCDASIATRIITFIPYRIDVSHQPAPFLSPALPPITRFLPRLWPQGERCATAPSRCAAESLGRIGALAVAFALAVLAVRAERAYRAEAPEWVAVRAAVPRPPDAAALGLIGVTFPSRVRTRVSAWYIPSRTGAAVILCHGSN